MQRLTILLLILTDGCSLYTQVQMDLVEQARKGVAMCRSGQESQRQLVEQLHTLQRARLDEAFDADVRERPTLSADWVVEHRRAYAAAIEVLEKQRQELSGATATAAGNLAAIDAALARLHWLQSIQSHLLDSSSITEGTNEK